MLVLLFSPISPNHFMICEELYQFKMVQFVDELWLFRFQYYSERSTKTLNVGWSYTKLPTQTNQSWPSLYSVDFNISQANANRNQQQWLSGIIIATCLKLRDFQLGLWRGLLPGRVVVAQLRDLWQRCWMNHERSDVPELRRRHHRPRLSLHDHRPVDRGHLEAGKKFIK